MDVKESLSQFARNSKRVLRVSKKPDKEEFLNFSKVTAIGIAIIGVIGFVIILIGELINI